MATPRARPHAPIYIENQRKTRKELGPIRADKIIRQRGHGGGRSKVVALTLTTQTPSSLWCHPGGTFGTRKHTGAREVREGAHRVRALMLQYT